MSILLVVAVTMAGCWSDIAQEDIAQDIAQEEEPPAAGQATPLSDSTEALAPEEDSSATAVPATDTVSPPRAEDPTSELPTEAPPLPTKPMASNPLPSELPAARRGSLVEGGIHGPSDEDLFGDLTPLRDSGGQPSDSVAAANPSTSEAATAPLPPAPQPLFPWEMPSEEEAPPASDAGASPLPPAKVLADDSKPDTSEPKDRQPAEEFDLFATEEPATKEPVTAAPVAETPATAAPATEESFPHEAFSTQQMPHHGDRYSSAGVFDSPSAGPFGEKPTGEELTGEAEADSFFPGDEPAETTVTSPPLPALTEGEILRLAWLLGSKYSYSLIAPAPHAAIAKADAEQIAALLEITLPARPATTQPQGNRSSNNSSAADVVQLLAIGRQVGEQFAQQYGAEHAALVEVAFKSNLLLEIYPEAPHLKHAVCGSVAAAAVRAQLPEETWKTWQDRVIGATSFEEVGEAVIDFHVEVERSLPPLENAVPALAPRRSP